MHTNLGTAIATAIAGGADTTTTTFTYGGGELCSSGVLATTLEATNLSGEVDGTPGEGSDFTPGHYTASVTTTTSNDLLVVFAISDNASPTTIVTGTNPYITLAQPGNTAIGWGVVGISYSGAPGTYSVTVNGTGGNNYASLVAFRTSGSFTPAAPPTFRYILAQDLPASVVESNQSNTFASGTTQTFAAITAAGAADFAAITGTGLTDFSGASDLYAPTSAGATGGHLGDLKYDSTNNNYHGYNGADAILADIPAGLNPTTNDCVKWTNTSGKIALADYGAGCGGTTAWNNIGAQTYVASINMASYETIFTWTISNDWVWTTSEAATSGASVNSPQMQLCGQFWTGSVSQADCWTWTDVIANGTNGDTQFQLIKGLDSSTGAASVKIPGLAVTPIAVSALPTASTHAGFTQVVSDSTSIVTEGQTCVGSSGTSALAFSNGTIWKCF